MEPYAGDVLETALNHGIAYAARRYEVSADQVRALVRGFANDIEALYCPCEVARAGGAGMMCFSCTGPIRPRINLDALA